MGVATITKALCNTGWDMVKYSFKWRPFSKMAAIFQNGRHFTLGIFLVIRKLFQWILWPPKHGCSHNSQGSMCIMDIDMVKCSFKMAAIFQNGRHYTLGIFLVIRKLFQWTLWPPKHGCRHKYEGSLCNTGWDRVTIMFEWWPFWKWPPFVPCSISAGLST